MRGFIVFIGAMACIAAGLYFVFKIITWAAQLAA